MRPSVETSPPGQTDSSPLVALAEIAVAALLVRAEGAFFQEHQLANNPLNHGLDGLNRLSAGEAGFFFAHAVAGLPAALLLTDAVTRLLGGRPAPWSSRVIAHSRLMAIASALFAAFVAHLITSSVLQQAPLVDDENTYLFQARQLLAGGFTSPRPTLGLNVFSFEQLYPVPGTNQWAGIHPPGQPLLVALGLLLHAPHLPQLVCTAIIVYVAARFADDLWGAEVSVVTAALLATSPLLLFNAATLHNAVPATCFLLIAIRAAFRAMRRSWRRDYTFTGLSLGAALLCRPYDAIAVGLPLTIALLITAFRQPSGARAVGTSGLALAAASALPFVLLLLAANHAVSGHPLKSAHAAWEHWRFPGTQSIGFGPTAFPEVYHSPQEMFSKGLVVLARLSTWLFGWPLSFWPLLGLLLGLGRDRYAKLLLVIVAVHFAAYALCTTNAPQDAGSPFHLVEAPLIAILSARAIGAMGGWLSVFGEWLSLWPGRLALCCGLVSLLTFWPAEVSWVRQTADHVRAPLDAAREAAGNRPSLVFWTRLQPETPTSWVTSPPPPKPDFSDQLLWVKDDPATNADARARYPTRVPLRLSWSEGAPGVTVTPSK